MYVDNALREAGLREEIKVIASGKVITGADLAIMIALGADLCQGARGFMLSIGCIHALKCNTNHCPAGIATHNPWLERGLVMHEKVPRVANYHHAVIHEFNSVMHACGKTKPQEFERSDVMKVIDHHKIVTMDEIVPQPPLKACKGGSN
jgi:glutamate synthase domain-containing protein 2